MRAIAVAVVQVYDRDVRSGLGSFFGTAAPVVDASGRATQISRLNANAIEADRARPGIVGPRFQIRGALSCASRCSSSAVGFRCSVENSPSGRVPPNVRFAIEYRFRPAAEVPAGGSVPCEVGGRTG